MARCRRKWGTYIFLMSCDSYSFQVAGSYNDPNIPTRGDQCCMKQKNLKSARKTTHICPQEEAKWSLHYSLCYPRLGRRDIHGSCEALQ